MHPALAAAALLVSPAGERAPSPVSEDLSPGPSSPHLSPGPSSPHLSLQPAVARPPRDPPRPAPTAPLRAGGLDVLPAAPGTPHTLYVNFDGAVLRRGCGNDSRHDCSTLADLFDGYIGPFVGTEARRVAIIESVRKDLKQIGVRTTWTRPPPEPGYTMVLYGDIGEQDFAGVAPYIDCGNLWANDTGFAGAFQGSNTGATIILQEAAHTWGLEHVNNPFDNLHPFVESSYTSFKDECNKIVADTDLVETAGACNQVHEMFCDTGYQNSFQELLYLFGPAQPDIVAPVLTLESPEDGSHHVLPVTLKLFGEVVDDIDPQFYAIDIQQAGQTLFTGEAIRVDLLLQDPPAGDYDLLVTVRDEAGNAGSDRVRFTILPEGSADPDGTDSDTDTGTGTGGLPDQDGGCRIAHPSAPASLALLLLLTSAAGPWQRGRRRAKGDP